MDSVSMVEFRRDAERIIGRVRRGQRILLTYRGRPVVRLEPVSEAEAGPDDPFYSLSRLANDRGESLSNAEMDRTVYGA